MHNMLIGFLAGCVFMMMLAVLMEWDENRIRRKQEKRRARERKKYNVGRPL